MLQMINSALTLKAAADADAEYRHVSWDRTESSLLRGCERLGLVPDSLVGEPYDTEAH